MTANADCPGRAIPDISAIADTNTAVYECYSTRRTTDSSGSVGGTSVAAPVMNGMEADTENFVAAQTYPGATPAIGFEGPIMYMLGQQRQLRRLLPRRPLRQRRRPDGGPDGESALPGWDEASGWGAIDWLHYSTGYATGARRDRASTTPSSLSQNYQWTCAQTPGNPTEHGISFPTSSVGYAVGTATSVAVVLHVPPERLVGRDEHLLQDHQRRHDVGAVQRRHARRRLHQLDDCVEVGDGGVINYTTNAGTTWTLGRQHRVQPGADPGPVPVEHRLLRGGDRGTILKSTDGGSTWSYSPSVDGNPIYGLSCPTTSNCYAVDNYGHVEATTNGGTLLDAAGHARHDAGDQRAGLRRPEPLRGALRHLAARRRPRASRSAATRRPDPGAHRVTTNGGSTWTAETSTDTTNNLFGV